MSRMLATVAFIALAAPNLHAMYSPELGCFINRDPGPEQGGQGAQAPVAERGTVIQRDPPGQHSPYAGQGYQDGMSLYGAYFVPNRLDPSGLVTQEQVAAIAQQLGLNLPMDHSQDTAVIQAMQKKLGVKADGFFGPGSVTAYWAWASAKGVQPVPLVRTTTEADVRRLIWSYWRALPQTCDCSPYKDKMTDILVRIFYYESWDTNLPGAPRWNTIGGPFGTNAGRQTAVGIGQITSATASDAGGWISRNDPGAAQEYGQQFGANWAQDGRYDMDVNMNLSMSLLYKDLTGNGCNVDRALSRWAAWTEKKSTILREAGVNQ
jgi:hypothetical protein